MLASAETIEAIADALTHHNAKTVVIDPVTNPPYPLPHPLSATTASRTNS
jgi:hypothetical protein